MRRARRLLRRVRTWLSGVPHLFAKATVVYCVAFGSLSSLWALRILSRTGSDPAALLGVILGFFGGELLLLSLKTRLTNRKEDNLEQHL